MFGFPFCYMRWEGLMLSNLRVFFSKPTICHRLCSKFQVFVANMHSNFEKREIKKSFRIINFLSGPFKIMCFSFCWTFFWLYRSWSKHCYPNLTYLWRIILITHTSFIFLGCESVFQMVILLSSKRYDVNLMWFWPCIVDNMWK